MVFKIFEELISCRMNEHEEAYHNNAKCLTGVSPKNGCSVMPVVQMPRISERGRRRTVSMADQCHHTTASLTSKQTADLLQPSDGPAGSFSNCLPRRVTDACVVASGLGPPHAPVPRPTSRSLGGRLDAVHFRYRSHSLSAPPFESQKPEKDDGPCRHDTHQ